MKKMVKKPVKKNEKADLKRTMTKLKRESNAKVKGFESQVKKQAEEIDRLKANLQEKDRTVEKIKKDLSEQKKGSSSKIKALEAKVKGITEELAKKEGDLQASNTLIDQKEVEMNCLRQELELKSQQLASKTLEMDNYEKSAKDRIFQLEARVKELEAKAGETSATS